MTKNFSVVDSLCDQFDQMFGVENIVNNLPAIWYDFDNTEILKELANNYSPL